jgi:hypothetical protein
MFVQVARLLKPGGSLIIFTPAFNFLWGLQDEVSHHVRRYSAKELRDKAQASGLVIAKLTYTNMFLFPLVWGGRLMLRLRGTPDLVISENDLHPRWSNGILRRIFSAERPLLNTRLSFGVSLLCMPANRRDIRRL